jgi:hypothetical protein
MATTIDQALQAINNLQQRIAQLQSENKYLRSKTEGRHSYHVNTTPRILRRALDDAYSIMVLKFDGFPVGRGYCYELGISERRYFWAMGLLRSARVVSPRGSRWLVDDFNVADHKLKANYECLKGQTNSLEMLRLYMPKKMQHAYSGKR